MENSWKKNAHTSCRLMVKSTDFGGTAQSAPWSDLGLTTALRYRSAIGTQLPRKEQKTLVQKCSASATGTYHSWKCLKDPEVALWGDTGDNPLQFLFLVKIDCMALSSCVYVCPVAKRCISCTEVLIKIFLLLDSNLWSLHWKGLLVFKCMLRS